VLKNAACLLSVSFCLVSAIKLYMKKYRSLLKLSSGFTLIELMVTVVILAVILGVGIPSFSNLIGSSNTDSVVRRLSSSLAYARSEAVTRAEEVVVCASSNGTACNAANDTGWASGWLVYEDDDGDGVLDGTETILRVENVSDLLVGFEVTNTTNNADINTLVSVCFDSLGEECGTIIVDPITSVTFTATRDTQTARLTLSSRGLVDIF
jgi:prepilin-type N-terminal cleavage/methylation domain-containing protein